MIVLENSQNTTSPATGSTNLKVRIEVNNAAVSIEPDHLPIRTGDRVQFTANSRVELTFTENVPTFISGVGNNPYTVGEEDLIIEIQDGNLHYPYDIDSLVETRSGHTSQGELHPPD